MCTQVVQHPYPIGRSSRGCSCGVFRGVVGQRPYRGHRSGIGSALRTAVHRRAQVSSPPTCDAGDADEFGKVDLSNIQFWCFMFRLEVGVVPEVFYGPSSYGRSCGREDVPRHYRKCFVAEDRIPAPVCCCCFESCLDANRTPPYC